MRIVDGVQMPGSETPKKAFAVKLPKIESGKNLWCLIGSPGVPLWDNARKLRRAVFPAETQFLWTEHDFIEDLIMLQKLNDRARTDDGIWRDYIDWENHYLFLRRASVLIFNKAFVGQTPFQHYEVYDLLSCRAEQQLPTIVCCGRDNYDVAPSNIAGLMESMFTAIEIDSNGQWPHGIR